jgi:hypothetical protein
MEKTLISLAGACVGAAAGFLLARTTMCAAGVCRTRAHRLGMIVAVAVLGAAVAWYFSHI